LDRKRAMTDAEIAEASVALGELVSGAIRAHRRRAEVAEAAGWLVAPILSELVATLDRDLQAALVGADAETSAAAWRLRERIVAGLPDDLAGKVVSLRQAEGARALERQAAERIEREAQRRAEEIAEALAKAPTPLRSPDPLRPPEA